MKLEELKANVRNPRKISDEQKAGLMASLQEFGDLGGIVYNRKNGTLVSGHQRVSLFPKDAKIKIEKKFETPSPTGTTAEGYIIVGEDRFKFREVEWDEERHATAMLAANKHGGSWDEGRLKVTFADFPNINKMLAGFELIKIEPERLKVTPQVIIPKRSESDEQADAKHIRETPQTTEQIPTGEPGAAAFPDVQEKKASEVSKRWVIIIDCKTEEDKQSLKEKLRPLVEEAQAKFF